MIAKRKGHVVSVAVGKTLLKNYGYPGRDLTKDVKDFQRSRGLPVTGIIGNRTYRALTGLRLCGCPDSIVIDGKPQWPKVSRSGVEGFWVPWRLAGQLPLLPLLPTETFRAAIEWACIQWQEVCGVRLYEEMGVAGITITAANLGGPGGVLADSELPYGDRVRQRYDSQERFVFAASPGQLEIDIGRVIAHELGHALGLGHTNEPGNLLNPTYSTTIRKPVGAWEIMEMRKRYGDPIVPSGGPAKPPKPATKIFVMPGDVVLIEGRAA